MTPLQAAELRLQTAAAVADERDRCVVQGADVRAVLAEIKRLRELLFPTPRD